LIDTDCLQYRLTKQEKDLFEKDGYIIVNNALNSDEANFLEDLLDFEFKKNNNPNRRFFADNVFSLSDEFVKFIDHPKILPKIWDILGWNISIYYTHIVIDPPSNQKGHFDINDLASSAWHQDGHLINKHIETPNRPRLTVKVSYYLSDCLEEGMASICIDKGNMSDNHELKNPIQIKIKRRDAIIFDRRLWHSGSINYSNQIRKAIFYGYGQRWLAPSDFMTVEHLWDKVDPIKKQLLRWRKTGIGFYTPDIEDIPLRMWLIKKGLAD